MKEVEQKSREKRPGKKTGNKCRKKSRRKSGKEKTGEKYRWYQLGFVDLSLRVDVRVAATLVCTENDCRVETKLAFVKTSGIVTGDVLFIYW